MNPEVAEAFVLSLFQMAELAERENEALRLMLRRRGVRRKALQEELNALRDAPAIKRRIEATIAPARKAMIGILREIGGKEMLAKLPVRIEKLQ